MNSNQFHALTKLIHEAECKAEDAENAAGVLFYDELLEALCKIMPKEAAESPRYELRKGPITTLLALLQPNTSLPPTASTPHTPTQPEQAEDKVPQFEELRQAYKKACTQ